MVAEEKVTLRQSSLPGCMMRVVRHLMDTKLCIAKRMSELLTKYHNVGSYRKALCIVSCLR